MCFRVLDACLLAETPEAQGLGLQPSVPLALRCSTAPAPWSSSRVPNSGVECQLLRGERQSASQICFDMFQDLVKGCVWILWCVSLCDLCLRECRDCFRVRGAGIFKIHGLGWLRRAQDGLRLGSLPISTCGCRAEV